MLRFCIERKAELTFTSKPGLDRSILLHSTSPELIFQRQVLLLKNVNPAQNMHPRLYVLAPSNDNGELKSTQPPPPLSPPTRHVTLLLLIKLRSPRGLIGVSFRRGMGRAGGEIGPFRDWKVVQFQKYNAFIKLEEYKVQLHKPQFLFLFCYCCDQAMWPLIEYNINRKKCSCNAIFN